MFQRLTYPQPVGQCVTTRLIYSQSLALHSKYPRRRAARCACSTNETGHLLANDHTIIKLPLVLVRLAHYFAGTVRVFVNIYVVFWSLHRKKKCVRLFPSFYNFHCLHFHNSWAPRAGMGVCVWLGGRTPRVCGCVCARKGWMFGSVEKVWWREEEVANAPPASVMDSRQRI